MLTERERVFRDLWVKKGCPKTLVIHVKSTRETIILTDGFPAIGKSSLKAAEPHPGGSPYCDTLKSDQLCLVTVTCVICGKEFESARLSRRTCSEVCRQDLSRQLRKKVQRVEKPPKKRVTLANYESKKPTGSEENG